MAETLYKRYNPSDIIAADADRHIWMANKIDTNLRCPVVAHVARQVQ
jgi:hypothetical protein